MLITIHRSHQDTQITIHARLCPSTLYCRKGPACLKFARSGLAISLVSRASVLAGPMSPDQTWRASRRRASESRPLASESSANGVRLHCARRRRRGPSGSPSHTVRDERYGTREAMELFAVSFITHGSPSRTVRAGGPRPARVSLLSTPTDRGAGR